MSTVASRSGEDPALFVEHARYLTGLGTGWGEARVASLRRELATGWLFPVRVGEIGPDRIWALGDRSSTQGVRIHALQMRHPDPAVLAAFLDSPDWGRTGPLYAVTDLLEGIDEVAQSQLFRPRGFTRRAMVALELLRVTSPPLAWGGVTLRALVPGDRDEFVRLHARVYREPPGDYWLSPSPSVEADAQSFFDQFLESGGGWSPKFLSGGSLACESDRRMVGTIVAGRTRQGTAHIYSLVVDPACQRRGIGRELILQALYGLRRAGVGRVTLSVIRDSGAHRLYNSVGFRRVGPPHGRLPGYWVRTPSQLPP